MERILYFFENFLTVFALMVMTVLFVSTSAFAETKNFDGCEVRMVPGTNYYNLVDPRCKGEMALHSSSRAEDSRAERLASKDEPEEPEDPVDPEEPEDPPSCKGGCEVASE